MKRPTEQQVQFPLLNLIYDPLSPHTVLVVVHEDWGLTGAVDIRYTSQQSLIDFNHVLQFAQNAVADEIDVLSKEWKAHVKKEGSKPF